jgi:glycosyltransferase involved in cell wall biosynthesis
MGIGPGRNRMLDEAKGRFFYSLDGDDTIAPNTIELLYNTANKNNAQIVYGSYERIFLKNGEVVRTEPIPYPYQVFIEKDIFADYVYHVGIQGMNWNYLIDINVIRRNNLRVTPVGHGYGEDFTFTIDLPTYIDRAVLLPDITYHYYIRDVDKHKGKKVLSRDNMEKVIKAVSDMKKRNELLGKRYYSKRISHLMMLDCSFACEMVGRRDRFDHPFSNREVRDIMWHPMSFWQIVSAKSGRFHNILYWTFGVVPPCVCVWLLKFMIRRYEIKKH